METQEDDKKDEEMAPVAENAQVHPIFRDILWRCRRDPAYFETWPSNAQMEYFKRGGR
mgnify:CR=1 FL=1